jgi:Na+-transporting NADH:ubiquinone oxidoreductase subunit E
MNSPDINPILIFVASIFTSNMIFSNFLGMCSYISVSSEYNTASGLGKAVTMVSVITAALSWMMYHWVIVPLKLEYLQYVLFIILIAAAVQIIEMAMDRFTPELHMKLGIFLPLITVNCAILGIILFMVIREYSFLQSLLFSLGSGLGWLLAIQALAAIREKMAKTKIPPGLEGPGITFVITGIMALAFIGFSGMVAVQ